MGVQHRELAEGRWHALTLVEQLGNIGSEVHRAVLAEGRNDGDFQHAFRRSLELLDLTLRDPRHQNRLKEIARVRELFCGAALHVESYRTTLVDLDRYLMHFAVAARHNKQ